MAYQVKVVVSIQGEALDVIDRCSADVGRVKDRAGCGVEFGDKTFRAVAGGAETIAGREVGRSGPAADVGVARGVDGNVGCRVTAVAAQVGRIYQRSGSGEGGIELGDKGFTRASKTAVYDPGGVGKLVGRSVCLTCDVGVARRVEGNAVTRISVPGSPEIA